MRLDPQIAPGGGRGGQWRRSARGRSRLGCGVEDAAMGRHSAAAGGSPCGLSRACRGAFDAVRARDAARAADRPRRRPWWPWSVHGGAHSRKPSARVARPQTIIAKHIAPAPQPMPTPTHAHSVGGVESGCHRVLHATQLHTGTELSASQARSRAVRQTPGGSPCCLSRACRGAFDAARARDAATAADRPRRRPWWSMAAIRARPLAPRLRRRRCRHGPTLGRGWRLAVPVSAERATERIRRSARQRCG
jgi:hypothetical protein